MLVAVAAGIGGLLWHNTRLNEANKKLHLASIEANVSAQEARHLKIRAEAHENLVRRQFAGGLVFGAQQALTARDYERALRMIEAAESEFGRRSNANSPGPFFLNSFGKRFEVRGGHLGSAVRMATAPDGRTIASGDDLGAIRLWDLATGKSRSLVSEHSIVNSIPGLQSGLGVLSPPRRSITAKSSSGTSCPAASAERWSRSAHRAVSALLFSTDGGRLAALGRQPGAGVRAVELWDLQGSAGTFPILGPPGRPGNRRRHG